MSRIGGQRELARRPALPQQAQSLTIPILKLKQSRQFNCTREHLILNLCKAAIYRKNGSKERLSSSSSSSGA